MASNVFICEVKSLSLKKFFKPAKLSISGKRTAGGYIVLFLKIIGTVLLIAVTTGIIFACIFTVYIQTNLTSELGVSLNDFKMSESSAIYCKDSQTGDYKQLVTLQSAEYRKWVDYKNIPPDAEHALVAIEDKRFYDHHGVDWYRTFGAFGNMFLSMKDNFGGSTITQQLIKNLTEDSDVTVQRKLLEIFRALQFEKDYQKSDIIEWYLNVVPFGGNTSGLGAAADYYFGKNASDLTLAECASIIGITNNPSKYNPYINKAANKARQESILTEMYNQGYISKERMEEAKSETLVFKKGDNNTSNTVVYTWFEDAVIEDVISDLMTLKNISKQAAENLLFTNGYKIYCTMDPAIQTKVDSVYQNLKGLPKVGGSSQQIQSAIVLANPYTGEILALEGGVGQKNANRLFNRATQSHRPPGSSIKPLSVYAPGIEFGVITPDTRIEDSANVRLSGTDWMPNNDDFKYSGIISIRTAVINSKNTVAAQIIDKLKPAKSYKFLTNTLGIELSPYDKDYAPLALGQLTNGITVREMASGYSMFDNNGVESHLITYSKLCDSSDKVIYENKPKTSVAISDVTAYWVTSMLQDAARIGTGSEAYLGSLMPVAGKTGTTTDKKDRWFAGYTPYYVAVVWTGFDTPATMKVSGNPAAQIWNKVMTLVSQGMTYKEFTTPTDTYLAPIPGITEDVQYIVRGVTVDGEVLYEIDDKAAAKGNNVTITANVIDGYEIVGSKQKTITITGDPSKNLFEFYYQPVVSSPPSTTSSSSPTDEPAAETPSDTTPTDEPVD
jgi:penicillin-binding protein 1A